MYWIFTSCQLLALQESGQQDKMKTCPKCESYIDDEQDKCLKCEEDHTFSFGIKVSRSKKEEAKKIEWDEKPNQQNCGVRKN